jgi:N-acetylglucosamine-6-phosphate deacetylase
MAKSLRNLVYSVGIELDEALRMVSLYPAQVMQKSDTMGMLRKGYDANIVILDESLEVKQLLSA